MKVALRFLALILLWGGGAHGESFVETQLLQDFFGPKGVEQRSLAYGGAVAQHYLKRPSIGETLPTGGEVKLRLLEETPERAIYEVSYVTEERTRHWSAFFQRTPLGSRLVEVKGADLPPYLYDRVFLDLVAKGAGRTPPEEARWRNLQLLLSGTAQLQEYFVTHQADLAEVARLVEADKREEAQALARRLDCAAVLPYGTTKTEGEVALLAAGKQAPQLQIGTEIRIGGFFASTVGYLHLPTGLTPPSMSPADYIQVEPLADNWYFFRNIAAPSAQDKKPKTD